MENIYPDLTAPTTQIKSKERVSTHGEVFTSDREVNAMLDLVGQETERIEYRFLEPACGNGNFLAKILERKLTVVRRCYAKSRTDYELYALIAVSSIYGVDIQLDNVEECRDRLYNIFTNEYIALFKNSTTEEYLKSIRYIIDKNILWGDALTLKTPDGAKPIIFSEWSAMGGKVKRRDFTLDNLLQNQPMAEPNLFSDLGDEAFIPTPVKEFPLTHYLKLHSYAE
ncbi:MAG: SAM-dependent DNA methyltransferase [Rikenellaceae bacterium]